LARRQAARLPAPAGRRTRASSRRGRTRLLYRERRQPAPFRFHIRSPSFINLSPLALMSIGGPLADAIVILGSVDIVVGEVDR
jgi:NADH:ubiquinone oxidoreductase subunit D